MQPKTVLIRGSLAVDTILLHRGEFQARILPDEISRLNVSFGIKEAREEFGGTGGNIAYGCSLLGDAPLVNASVGGLDAGLWPDRLASWGFDPSALNVVPGKRGAHAYILTDSQNNQITAFQAGALSHVAQLPASGFDFAHLAPDSAGSMAMACKELAARGVPYFLDPGQGLAPLLEGQDGADFKSMLSASVGLFVNDYEAELCAAAFNEPFEAIAARLPLCVRTLGSKGCELWLQGQEPIHVPVCKPSAVIDPTGCGDAFRSGFLHGHAKAWDPVACAQLGSVMGSFAIEKLGGQNHAPSMQEVAARYDDNFGSFPSSKAARPAP